MKQINRQKYSLLCIVFYLIQPFEFYEPLNLNVPNEYEVPTGIFKIQLYCKKNIVFVF